MVQKSLASSVLGEDLVAFNLLAPTDEASKTDEETKSKQPASLEAVEMDVDQSEAPAKKGKVIASCTAFISKDQLTLLEKAAAPSLVGKNEKTVLDTDVRKSLEIPASQIRLTPEFEKMIATELEQMRQKLMHPIPLKAVLYKLVYYRPGDHFAEVDGPDHWISSCT
jgi:hypothetical protein